MSTDCTRVLPAIALALGLAGLAACTSYTVREDELGGQEDGAEAATCGTDECVCQEETSCELDCEGDDCALECRDGDECDASCGDRCDYMCADVVDCELACGDACAASCADGASCDIVCGDDCNVACTDMAECSVAMRSGLATCAFVSDCDITCLGPVAVHPAEDCGGGVFACGDCPL